MDLDKVPSLQRNKPVQSNIANPGDFIKIHLITLTFSILTFKLNQNKDKLNNPSPMTRLSVV